MMKRFFTNGTCTMGAAMAVICFLMAFVGEYAIELNQHPTPGQYGACVAWCGIWFAFSALCLYVIVDEYKNEHSKFN